MLSKDELWEKIADSISSKAEFRTIRGEPFSIEYEEDTDKLFLTLKGKRANPEKNPHALDRAALMNAYEQFIDAGGSDKTVDYKWYWYRSYALALFIYCNEMRKNANSSGSNDIKVD